MTNDIFTSADLHVHNQVLDSNISQTLAKDSINKTMFDWLLANQVITYDANNAKTNESVSNNFLYPSINHLSSPKASLYAEPSDYTKADMYLSGESQLHSASAKIHFLNALFPLSLHWQSDNQPIENDVFVNLSWQKQKQFQQTMPLSINKIKQQVKAYQVNAYKAKAYNDPTFIDETDTNHLADALLKQIDSAAKQTR